MALPTGFNRPSLSTIIDRIAGDFNAQFPNGDARVARSVLYVTSRVLGAAVYTLHGFASWIARQILPDTAEDESLERHGSIWGVTRIAADAAADGQFTFTGNGGVAVPAGTTVVRTADGAEYTTDALVTTPVGAYPQTVVADATASVAGTDGNAGTSVLFELSSPIAGIDTAVVCSTAFTDGTDEESDADYLARILLRIQETPQGGSYADYEQWALESAEEIDRAWVYGAADAGSTVITPGSVWVYFTVTSGGAPTPIPAAGQITTLDAYLEDTSRKPVPATVVAKAPVDNAVNLSIYLEPNGNATIEAAVEDEIDAMFAREAEPLPGGQTIRNSKIHDAIAAAQTNADVVALGGITYWTVDAVDGGAGTADISVAAFELSRTGTITWT